MKIREDWTVTHCEHCKGEVYVGDEVMRVSGDSAVVHGWPRECAKEYAVSIVYDAVGTINVRGEIE